ncbi:excalibur calcium-binding domain-containing protein [Psychrobacillus sp. NEAU-3TGS]|uniref:excalibur calcium-binding domain-containing protein n=1 Tax=Psychrobacillus sp. NEAU-3TGS TaxID=2995412 RepID=UPI0024977CC0|nr:excalibur calcium-binding domain-containing protein [Psychrobacillus sp. NEAU-3TGS]MDI2588468.1 excalibur calcium-binding domain-containing protein [Psychrobacillus sp. NEAU-3TGS]
MKRTLSIALATSLIFSGSAVSPTPADAAGKVFKNCTELNKAYKGGVAKAANVKNKGGKTKYAPFVSKEIYDANAKSDRDKDGIACER